MSVNPRLKAWSMSRLNLFEQCPHKYLKMNVQKVVKDEGNEYTKYGTEAHKALEERIAKGKKLPRRFAEYESIAQRIEAASGKVYTELQLAIDTKFKPCDWFDETTYARAIIDVLRINGSVAWSGDYKTGKMKDNDDQLELNAVMIFLHYPEVQKVISSYIWLKDKHITRIETTRDQIKQILKGFVLRAKKIERALIDDHWEAIPSGLCRYCPVKSQGHCSKG
jgi:hypothetical protein